VLDQNADDVVNGRPMGGIKLPTAENDFSPACQHIHNQLMSARQTQVYDNIPGQ